ncbi:MAG: hypothetical protein AAGA16_17030 [Cyanobacteria bacterium P01_E01_bin.35]
MMLSCFGGLVKSKTFDSKYPYPYYPSVLLGFSEQSSSAFYSRKMPPIPPPMGIASSS